MKFDYAIRDGRIVFFITFGTHKQIHFDLSLKQSQELIRMIRKGQKELGFDPENTYAFNVDVGAYSLTIEHPLDAEGLATLYSLVQKTKILVEHPINNAGSLLTDKEYALFNKLIKVEFKDKENKVE